MASSDAVLALWLALTVVPCGCGVKKPLVLVGPLGSRTFWVNGYEGKLGLLSLPSF